MSFLRSFMAMVYSGVLKHCPKSGHSLISVTRKYLGEDLFRYKLIHGHGCLHVWNDVCRNSKVFFYMVILKLESFLCSCPLSVIMCILWCTECKCMRVCVCSGGGRLHPSANSWPVNYPSCLACHWLKMKAVNESRGKSFSAVYFGERERERWPCS